MVRCKFSHVFNGKMVEPRATSCSHMYTLLAQSLSAPSKLRGRNAVALSSSLEVERLVVGSADYLLPSERCKATKKAT